MGNQMLMARPAYIIYPFSLFLFLICIKKECAAQSISDSNYYITVQAGPQYKKNSFHQWLWGKHYRKDWYTPVQVKLMNLDTVNGGLKAYQAGGGRQTQSLRLRNEMGKEYVLRSIDKSYTKALAEIYKGTVIEKIMNDQVSMAEPYAAITIAPMAEAAGIFHTNPQIVFIKEQDGLNKFNKDFSNKLYLLEERPDENWEEAAHLGNSKNIVGTDKMLENVFETNKNRVNQLGFVRARLFDMFIGDWGRQEDQWRWASYEDGEKKMYKAIPRDRDQAFTKLDGVLLSIGMSAGGAGHLETFGHDIKNVAEFNYPARNLDRQMTNEVSREQWISIAKDLQLRLTNDIIESSIKKLPPEVFPISGPEMISKLKSRRDHLVEYASDYYSFLTKEVEITGTKDGEYFEINVLNKNETEIKIYDLGKKGNRDKVPFYSRKFFSNETKEIRLYGIAGDDQFIVNNGTNNTIRIRIIGGIGKNRYWSASKAKNIHIYDSGENDLENSGGMKKHLSDNPFVNMYRYQSYEYDSKGLSPSLFYSSDDHFYTGLKYEYTNNQWRKFPFGQKHSLSLKYSITEKAFNTELKSEFIHLIGRWDLQLEAGYDFMRWNNFYGIGNETKMLTDDRDFHRVRSHEFLSEIKLKRNFGIDHQLSFTGNYQVVKIISDPQRYFYKYYDPKENFNPVNLLGIRMDYGYKKINNPMLPTKGIDLSASVSFTDKLNYKDSSLARYFAQLKWYAPLSKSFVYHLKTGAASLHGKPEFFQLNQLGGGKSLRGFRRSRFYGTTTFYAQNEIQFIRDIKTGLINGKAGIVAFYDIGRVWQPGEISKSWHSGYGAGIIFSPFNKFAIIASYGFSRNERAFSARVQKSF